MCAANLYKSASNRHCWTDTRLRRTPPVLHPRTRDSRFSCHTPFPWVCIRCRSRRCRNRIRWRGRICARVLLQGIGTMNILLPINNNNNTVCIIFCRDSRVRADSSFLALQSYLFELVIDFLYKHWTKWIV